MAEPGIPGAAADEDLLEQARRLPPLMPMVAALVLDVCLMRLLLPALGVDFAYYSWAWLDPAVVLAVGVASRFVRTEAEGTSKQPFWDRWERPGGTMTIAVVMLLFSFGLFVWLIGGRLEWLGLVLAALLISGVAILWALIGGRATQAPLVIAAGEQPEPLADYERVELRWSLEPNIPDQDGVVSVWYRKATLAEFRRDNPQVVWEGNLPRLDWFVDNGQCDELNDIADRLLAVSRQQGLDDFLELSLVLDLVQKIRYVSDKTSTGHDDYWRFPLETIADGEGDCDDFAILAVALLSAMGHRTCFFHMPGHVAIGVAEMPEETGVSFEAGRDSEQYYFVETTEDGWRIGELPDGISRDSIRVAGLVAPHRSRRKLDALQRVAPGEWRSDGQLLLRGTAVTAAGGAALASGLHWVATML